MKIRSLKIKNYICFKEVIIKFCEKNFIVGQNNIGKTLTFKIIKMFFERARFRYNFINLEDFMDEDTNIEFEITFDSLNGSEMSLFEKYLTGLGSTEENTDVLLILKLEVEKIQNDINIQYKVVCDDVVTDHVPGLEKKLNDCVNFIYIEAFDTFTQDYNPKRKSSIFSKLLEIVINQDIRNKILEKLQVLNSEFSSISEVAEFNDIFKLYLSDLTNNFSVISPNLEIGAKEKYKILQNFQIILDESGIKKNPFTMGDGIKSLFLNALYQVFLNYKTKENPFSYLVLLDEPEMHLHPHTQRFLINTWEELLKSIKKQEEGNSVQMMVATHSTEIINPSKNTKFLFYHFLKDGSTGVHGKSLSTTNKKEKNIIFALQQFPEIIFANKIIICEGKTDYWYLKLFSLKRKEFNLNKFNISLIYADTVSKIPNYFILKDFLPSKIKAIFDSDKGKNINVEKACKINGIDFKTFPVAIEKSISESLTYEVIWSFLEELNTVYGLKAVENNIIKILKESSLTVQAIKNWINQKNIQILKSLKKDIESEIEEENKKKKLKSLRKIIQVLLSKNKHEFTCLLLGNLISEQDVTAEIESALKFIIN